MILIRVFNKFWNTILCFLLSYFFSFFLVQSVFGNFRNPPERSRRAEMLEHQAKNFRVNPRRFRQNSFERIKRNTVLKKLAANARV